MSFLTVFPEAVYPAARLAAAVRTDGFDIATAHALMWLAQAAYETTADPPSTPAPRKLERILGRWGFPRCTRLSRGGTEGFVAESADALVVSFAGTDPVVAGNWLTDFDVRIAEGGCHRGFSDGVAGIWPALAASVEGAKPVVLTGHSLGGALAAVAAWRLAREMPAARIGAVVMFGAPRLGNDAFTSDYRSGGLWSRTVRLEYGSDIVPSLPPAARGERAFRPVGQRLYCPHGGQFADALPPQDDPPDPVLPVPLRGLLDFSSGETFARFRDIWGRLIDPGGPRSPAGATARLIIDRLPFFLRDHCQDSYLAALGWPGLPDTAPA